jgi:hypothetical protein
MRGLDQGRQFRQHVLLVAVPQPVPEIGKPLLAGASAPIQPGAGAFIQVLCGMVKV